jgi:hypothetical protein
MTNLHFDAALRDDDRRTKIYAGDIFVYGPNSASLALTEFARTMVEEAFAPFDPEFAQFDLPVGEYAEILKELKPKFIHHPRCKELLPAMLRDLGCDLAQTYFDVPRLRTSTSNDYLTTGIAYAFHPHRDTWYSAPTSQINWWLPIYPLAWDNGLAFHPRYFDAGFKNSSHEYDYQEWNRTSRFQAASQVRVDTRRQPRALETIEIEPQIRPLPPAGGMIVFSAAQLHSSVPNTSGRTRFSIDFRTVHRGDVSTLRGAANVDSWCTGSTMQDYLRGTDLTLLPRNVIAPYDRGPPQKAPEATRVEMPERLPALVADRTT